MGHNQDWIPVGQGAFVEWSQQFVAALSAHGSDLAIAATLVTEVATKQAAFMSAWNTLAEMAKGEVKTEGKKTRVAGHRKYLRDFYNANLRYNVNLTGELRVALGVPHADTTHTRFTVGDRELGFELAYKGVGKVGIRCWDAGTGEKKILYGMGGIMVIYGITPEPVTDEALLTHSAFITKTRRTFQTAADQKGKRFSAACAWQSESGELGGMSAIQSVVIS